MKKIYLLLLVLTINAYAQPPGQWMWIHGSNTIDSPGNFGVQGVPSPTNTPPALYEPCEWTDLNGNYWIFGGANFFNFGNTYAALWKYEPLTNQWTWMKGPNTLNYAGNYGAQNIPSPTNEPPSRSHGTATWVDLQGNLWLGFGIRFSQDFMYSDMWKYNISTNEWTWVKGPNTTNQPGVYGIQGVPDPANNPPFRSECSTTWTDNAGDLWLFGGYYLDGINFISHVYNDLWRFNIATNTWTWMKGSNTTNQPAVYGIQNVEDPANTPGGRYAHCRWKANDGTLWLFGGANEGTDYYNDLWRYNVATNNWTWVSGSNIPNDPGSYGTKCVIAPSNVPSARFESRAAVKDQYGNFWLFAGGTPIARNDVWLYCVATNQWTWISGDNIPNPAGNWGTINVPSPTNKPSGRIGAVAWRDNSNHLYFFGGMTNTTEAYNDLWKFTIDTAGCYPCQILQQQSMLVTVTGSTPICAGSCTNVSASVSGGNAPYTYSWTPNIGTGAGPHQVCPASTTTYSVLVTDSSGNTAVDSVSITVNPLPTILTSSSPAICVGDSAVLNASGASTYSWSPCTNLNPCTGSAVTAFPADSITYTVTGTDVNGCSATATILVTVNSLPLVASPPAPQICAGGTVTITMSGADHYIWSPQTGLSNPNGPDSTSVDATLNTTTTYTVTGFSVEGCSATTSVTVTVNPIPVPVITPNGPTSFCEGGSVILTASGGSNFLWSDNTTGASITVNASGTYTVIVTQNNCSASTSETVTVNPLPVATINPAGPVLICSNSPALLTAISSLGYTYQWYMNNNIFSGETNQALTVSDTGFYSVVVTDANNCSASSSLVQVIQGVGPVVTIQGPPQVGCLQNTIYIGYGPQSATLTAVSSTAVSYLWSTGATTQSISVTTSGTYTVTGFDTNGCPSEQSPESAITITVIDIRCGHGMKKILFCHVPEGNPDNPQTICIPATAVASHLALHQYDCIGPCSLYYQRMSPVTSDEIKVMLYPNPFNNSFTISVENSNGGMIHLNLTDVTGRIIISDFKFYETAQLGEDLSQGIYYVEIMIADKKEMLKIVKL
jgi:Galactose oxidase, central domain/Secretion system C-terminal sorting domain